MDELIKEEVMLYYIWIAVIVNAMQMYVASRRTDFYGRK